MNSPAANNMGEDKFIGCRAITGHSQSKRKGRRQILVGDQTYLPHSNVTHSLKANMQDGSNVPSHLLTMQKNLLQSKEDRLLENYFGARVSGSRSLTQSGFSKIRKQIVKKTQNL